MRDALTAHLAVSGDSSEADRAMHLQDRAAMLEDHRKVFDACRGSSIKVYRFLAMFFSE